MSSASPSEFVEGLLNREVTIVLSTGSEVVGKLICLDVMMNVVLSDAFEYSGARLVAAYDQLLLRGNNIAFISTHIDAALPREQDGASKRPMRVEASA